MSQDPEPMSLHEREARLAEYRTTYDWALGTLSQRALSSESARDFVQDKTATGIDHVLLRLADTKFALFIFIEASAQGNGDLWSTITSIIGGNTSKPIENQTTYTLACLDASGHTLSKTTVVNVLPKWKEE